jgi:hypothetical protein
MKRYGKPEPKKSMLDPQRRPDTGYGAGVPAEPLKDAGRNYRKEEGRLSPKSFFVIVSGGERTERMYFKIISRQDRFRRIKIEFISDAKQLYPKGLLETAKQRQAHYESSREDEPDRIFIVSDVDHFMNELLEIKPECEKFDISLIISNSCFEVWLYYAFYPAISNFKPPEKKEHISRSFRQWMPSNINPGDAIFHIHHNIKTARKHYEEDENGIPVLFSTNMFLLAESLLPCINDELEKLIEEKRQKMEQYKV